MIGGMLGIMLAMGGALLLENMRDTVRYPEQISRRFGVNNLGVIFKWSDQEVQEGDLVVWESPKSNFAETFRQIRANFEFAVANKPGNAFLVCSPGPGEGKSTVIANLAASLAQTGKRVAVVDGDLRRPSLHTLFKVKHREPGLSNVLADGSANVEDAIREIDIEGIGLVASGPSPPNPAELLGSSRMKSLLTQLKDTHDVVLVDSPPILLVADGSLIASQVDGVVVVVDALATRSSSLQAALDTIKATQVEVIGVVVNKLKRPRFGYGYAYPYYYYYYSYDRYYSESDEIPVDGNAPFYRKASRRARAVWSRLRPGPRR
jgi:capsular exopolysaccharide synthesis family protein